MLISYNWLKWYLPDAPSPDKLVDIFNYHLCEVETVEHRVLDKKEDWILDLKILPNRAHDLLSHQGVARELASLLDIKYADPAPKYKIPASVKTAAGKPELKINVRSDKCRRYMGRIVRGVTVGPSPDWVVKHLESIGQRSINNMVDAANIVMFDCGQPAHVFDLNKIKNNLVVRQAKDGEELTTLDNKNCNLKSSNMIISDLENPLAIAGVKGGKVAEVDNNTKDIILEVANFDPTSVRKTAQALNIFTDARKRFENDLSPELAAYGMMELSALIFEMCPDAIFEDIVDVYPKKQEKRKLSFSAAKISKILGVKISDKEIEDILKRHNFKYDLTPPPAPLSLSRRGAGGEVFTIVVPPMRLDLAIEEDMAEEVGRILGYDKVKGSIPKINLKPKVNETYQKILWARNKLLSEGWSEVMTYTFRDKGEVEVQNSASDKKFLRTNLSEGLKESLKLNQLNAPLLGIDKIKIFEIGTVFKKDGEQMNVCYGDKKNITEISLNDFCKNMSFGFKPEPKAHSLTPVFKMWPLFPFIARDIAVWVPGDVKSSKVLKVIKESAGDLVTKGPDLFDEFSKDGKKSYAFRLVFQSYERTLTDSEVNEIMEKIANKLKANEGWQVR